MSSKHYDDNGLVVTHFKSTPCPRCNHRLDAAAYEDGKATPTAGDTTICLECEIVLVFGADLRPRLPTADELAALERDHRAEIKRARDFVRRFKRARRDALPPSARFRKRNQQ